MGSFLGNRGSKCRGHEVCVGPTGAGRQALKAVKWTIGIWQTRDLTKYESSPEGLSDLTKRGARRREDFVAAGFIPAVFVGVTNKETA